MKDIMSIKKRLEQKSAINGKAGVAIMSGMLNEEKIRNLVIKHYNSITCENEMKPEIIWETFLYSVLILKEIYV